jgi:hypothetical protein
MRFVVMALLLAGCAAPGPSLEGAQPATAERRQCFQASSLNGFQIIDRDTVDLEVGPSQVFRAELFGACLGLEEAMRVGVAGRGGSGWVCHGADAEILLPQSPIGPQRCRARTIRMLTEAELAERPR